MKLESVASVIRSKNSGPYLYTIDIFVDDKSDYQWLKEVNKLSLERVAKQLKITEDKIEGIYYFNPVNGIKITYLRDVSSGTYGDLDVYGTQQYIKIIDFDIGEKHVKEK